MLQECRSTGTRIQHWWGCKMIRVTLNDRLAVSYKTQHTLSYDLANDLDTYLRA